MAGNKLKHAAFKHLKAINQITSDIKEADDMFKAFDYDQNGVISEDELHQGYREWADKKGEIVTEEELSHRVRGVLKRLDIAGNGVLNYDEFILLFAHDLFNSETLRTAFDAFDDDNSGVLSIENIVNMGHIGEDLDFWQSIIGELDPTGKGGINFEEFCDLVLKYAD
jgi:Ca2+-binding EF-hand superfamily protein